ncbi:hypothetical protein [Methylobacterium radiotolerans]|uniref:hypothetical protein n=1 Tax=Methylobacterium radiotolerans TaxID=31998 RepID=UPI001F3C6F9D|nr:hypothetical protein [Methylobacterium radiotolerans]UIY40820.1 hypothetical protein LZ599_20675 [Methylobacterium radiotolerans]
MTDPKVIMRKPKTPFRELPSASEVSFPGVFAWSAITSAAVTTALGADPGSWNVWRNRRLTPAPLPRAWFRRATGSPLIYQVSDVLVWLATKRGEQLNPLTTWRLSLARDLGTKTSDPVEIRRLAVMYARAVGPVIGGVRFTTPGFQAYLASLLSSSQI